MIALILARGGSKRLPGKNTMPLCGKPMIRHTLETALASRKISRVLVSTDSQDIRDMALQISGVEAPFLRPAELASDTAQAYDVHMHAIQWLEEHEKTKIESFCVLLPTSPLRLPEDIDGAVALFEEAKADVVASVYRTKPLAWHLTMDEKSRKMEPLLKMDARDAVRNYQEQEQPPVILNGSIYAIRRVFYEQSRSYFGPKTYGYEMPWSRSIDIDVIDEFRIAEALMRLRG